MPQLETFKAVFKAAQDSFKAGIEKATDDFHDQQKAETGRVSLDDGYLDLNAPPDHALLYCLTETIRQAERLIKDKPGREIALVKTKLQEALFWASQI